MPAEADLGESIRRGLRFLEATQREDGEFPNLIWEGPAGPRWDANVFPAALIAHCLSFVPGSEKVSERAIGFLEREMGPNGLWRHWARRNPNHGWAPDDVDDTAWASTVLAKAGRPLPDNRALVLANRDRRGLFYTWFAPRPRWTGLAHVRACLRPLRHMRGLIGFFVKTGSSINDVDGVVNANVLAWLGRSSETEPVAAWLLDLLRRGTEDECDKYYPSRFAIWYFFSRALRDSPEAGAIIQDRLAAAAPGTALDHAFAACTPFYWGRTPEPALIAALVELQKDDGGWDADTLYVGDHCRWGSEQLTTAFSLEALARSRSAIRG